MGAKIKAFYEQQEAVRKDIGYPFLFHVQSWQIVARPWCLWDKAGPMNLVLACVVLRKMNREARCDDYNVYLHGSVTSGDSYSSYARARQFGPNQEIRFSWEGSTAVIINGLPAGTLSARVSARRLESEDEVTYRQLPIDLVERIWNWNRASLSSA